ncbi:hypothetical protein GAYE_SCF65G6810 [Galdieria yellowstonensis]|uniref:C3H1-type domain-containing protein n=1 Tax=Galdieria yellowstonensis TaxID=3028027 RepID=A0AAV9INK3_9RHOD|nr:hypothetical protein GAYE_SCF65G6810 [Galdieria yellowstonensis]
MGFPETSSYCSSRVKEAQRLNWEATSGGNEQNTKEFFERTLSLKMEGLNLDKLDSQVPFHYCFGSFETTELVDPQRHETQEKVGENSLVTEQETLNKFQKDPSGQQQSSEFEYGREDSPSSSKKESVASNVSLVSDAVVSMGERNNLYKTELCRSFMETGFCRYGGKCQFAHGTEELRQVKRHPKYKTRYCRNFMKEGNCPYGSRCRFIHHRRGSFDGLETDLLYAVEGLLPVKKSTSPRSRLPIFQKLQEECAEDIDSS